MKIAVLLPDLRPGGAEKMRLKLAAAWLRQGCQVEFVLQRREGELLEFVPEGATVRALGGRRLRNTVLRLVRYLKTEKPDSLLVAMWPLTVIAPVAARLAGYAGSVVVSEHNNMTAAYAGRGALHRVLMAASMRVGYRLADAVVCVSEGVASDLANLSARSPSSFRVIHNPACAGIDASGSQRPGELLDRRPVIVAVGTLKRQKRFDVLLDAFARMPSAPTATLCIVGEGPLRQALQSQARALGIAERVLFPGFRPDVAAWYAHSDLFVLSSDYEGFGNVIVEALEQGTPVVSTDCPSGPREILDGGAYGALVPVGDVDALATAMEHALSRPHDRQALRRRAHAFSVEGAAREYLDLLFPTGGLA